MKRKLLLIVAVLILAAAPVFCDWRVDLGADVVFGVGAANQGDAATTGFGGSVLLLPVFEGSYQWEVGPVHIGAGVAGSTLIVLTVFWPDVFAEMELGRFAVEGHLGGLLFGGFGIESFLETGQVLVPQLSGWFRLTKRFKVGSGAIGLWFPGGIEIFPDVSFDGVAFLYYVGCKWVLSPG